MIVYLGAFLTSLLLYFGFAGNRKTILIDGKLIKPKARVITNFGVAVFLASLPPMLVSSIRYFVGTDYFKTYYTGFYRIMDGSVIDRFEVGFFYLIKLIQVFSNNVFWLFAITSVIYVGVVYKAMADISIDVPLSIVLFLVTRYYFVGMNGVRQFIGLAFLTYSIRYVFDRNLFKFLEYVFFACCFHYSCVFFIPVFFIAKIRLTVKRVLGLIVATIIAFDIGAPLLLKTILTTRYGLLAARKDVAGIKFTIFTICLNLIIFLIGYYEYDKKKNDIKFCTCLNIQLLALLTSLGLRLFPLVERIYWMFSFPIIITLPYLLEGIQNVTLRRRIRIGIILIFTVYMVYDICILKDHGVLPYQWIIGKTATKHSGWKWYGGRVR